MHEWVPAAGHECRGSLVLRHLDGLENRWSHSTPQHSSEILVGRENRLADGGSGIASRLQACQPARFFRWVGLGAEVPLVVPLEQASVGFCRGQETFGQDLLDGAVAGVGDEAALAIDAG